MEITLLGQNVDRYGASLEPRTTLGNLLSRLSPVPGLRRLRFVTSHPHDIGAELLQAMRDLPNVMPYLHVPAQSGSNRILAAMRRGYTRERYLEIVDMAKQMVPGVGMASDFIVGFPGETDVDLEETLSLVSRARFQHAFIFKYSPRPGTPAGRLEDDVPREVKEQRHKRLSELQHTIGLSLNQALVGTTVEVLAEGVSRSDPNRYTGRTPSGRIVAFGSPSDPTGRIVDVLVEEATPLVLLGHRVAT
jgi:tRNA-2-methylthio-N6-dimethylallyladenosine synthase